MKKVANKTIKASTNTVAGLRSSSKVYDHYHLLIQPFLENGLGLVGLCLISHPASSQPLEALAQQFCSFLFRYQMILFNQAL